MPEIEPPKLPPVAAAPLSVVLFAGGSGDRAAIVADWRRVLDAMNRDYEIILADDGGDTAGARCLHLKDSPGVGAALRAGIKAARHPLLCYAPCDPRYRPEDVRPLLERIDHVHLVSAARVGRPLPRAWRWLGKFYRGGIRVLFGVPLDAPLTYLGWQHRTYQGALRLLFGLRLSDAASPMKLFRRLILNHFPLQSEGPFVHVEILAKANFMACYMDEVLIEAPGDEVLCPWGTDGRRLLANPVFRAETAGKRKEGWLV